VVQHAEGVRTGEIIQASNRKTFLDQNADGFVFGIASSSVSLPLRTINHDMVKHEGTTKGDDECAITDQVSPRSCSVPTTLGAVKKLL
jgi:hypothetical protein